MALLKSCVHSRCYANFFVQRRFGGLASVLACKNSQKNIVGYQVRHNGTSWQTSYHNFFKSVTESDAVDIVKNGLVYAHDVTGLPWGWAIILTTLGLRATITFPLGVYQSFVLAKLELVKQEFGSVVQELKRETALAVKKFGLTENVARRLYNQSLKTQWRKIIERENCHPLKATLVVFIQLPMWILLSLSYRCMSCKLGQDPVQSAAIADQMAVEGIAWVSDLLVPDPTWILPLSVMLINLCIIELQASTKANPTKPQRIMTNVFRALAVASFPIALSVPSCLSLYWCASSGLALTQNALLMSPSVKKFFKVPHTPSQLNQPYQHAWNNFKTKWTFSKFFKNGREK